jgi:cell division protein FtsW (lipid II flippase)
MDKLTEYIKLKGEQLKLEILSHVARVLAYAITFIIIGLIAAFLGLFAALTLAVYLNYVLDSVFWGYVIVCGLLVVLLLIFVILLKTQKIQRWLEAMIVKIGNDE